MTFTARDTHSLISRHYDRLHRYGPEPNIQFFAIYICPACFSERCFCWYFSMDTTSAGPDPTTFASSGSKTLWEVWKIWHLYKIDGLTATEWVEYVLRCLTSLTFFLLIRRPPGNVPASGQSRACPLPRAVAHLASAHFWYCVLAGVVADDDKT